MRKSVLFIGMSLDGYIADVQGGVEWMGGQTQSDDDMQSYEEFIKEIDTVIMGWNTYNQIANELSPKQWLYEEFYSYVVTHRDLPLKKNIEFTKQSPEEILHKLKQQDGKDIWICGGATIVSQLIEADLIDRFHVSVLPILLGDGIRLFSKQKQSMKLQLVKTQSYNGITDLIYERR